MTVWTDDEVGGDIWSDDEPSQNTTADEVTFVQSGTGAISRTVQDRLRDAVHVFDFIPVAEHAAIVAGTSTTDVTSYIQAAIDTGRNVVFQAGTYKAVGLTQSTNGQCLVCADGVARIVKNANGVIFTASGDNVQCVFMEFRGESASPSFTGDNVNATGDDFSMIHCNSLFAFGRAVKSTGNHTCIIGTNDIYQTASTGATDYDIEVGVSGTATLYHQIEGVVSTQSTGGILLVDTGGAKILGGQFGKLKIDSGTGPAGSGGNVVIGPRILGAVTIELPSTIMMGCLFGADGDITLAATTSGCVLVGNVYASGCTITNSGNVSNLIIREVSAGGSSQIKLGDDNSLAIMTTDHSQGAFSFPRLKVEVVATASLPSGNSAHDGRVIIEDGGAGNRNLIVYAGGERFRIDGGAAF